jgi:oligopeptide transport system substrate-binding protein
MWKQKLSKITLFLILCLTNANLTCKEIKEKRADLKLSFSEDVPSLHPHRLMTPIRGRSIGKLLFEGLTRINAQGKAELAGAEKVDISPDQLQYTFTLRNNKWSDGTPVTAFHYVEAWKETLSPTSFCERAYLLYMIKHAEQVKKGELPLESVGIKALDEKTIVVTLAYPFPEFLNLLTQAVYAPLLDPKVKEPSIFNGPFILLDQKINNYLKLKANPYFWDKQSVSLNQIEISIIKDISTALALYQQGGSDWMGSPFCPLLVEMIEQLNQTSALKSNPIDRFFFAHLNTKHSLLSSPLIRKAFNFAINRTLITQHIHPDFLPVSQYFSSNPPSSHLQDRILEAQKLFDQGLKELGLTKKTLPPLKISYCVGYKLIAEYLQEVWSKAFGISITLEGQEWHAHVKNLYSGDFEVGLWIDTLLYSTDFFERNINMNPPPFSRWSHPVFKEKVAQAKLEKDGEHRSTLFKEANEILVDETPFILLAKDKTLFTHHPKLKGYIFDATGGVDFSRAYLEQESDENP